MHPHTHARGDPRARPLGAEEGARGPEPKAEELALRQGAWDAGGERRLHKEKQPFKVRYKALTLMTKMICHTILQ